MSVEQLPCRFCEYTAASEASLRVHLGRYHERELADAGKRLRQGEAKLQGLGPGLRRLGWEECPFVGVMCPGPPGKTPSTCEGFNECQRKEGWPPGQVENLRKAKWWLPV